MFVVYILKSKLYNRYYTGHTNDLDIRLERHNKGYVKSTKSYKPWIIVYTEKYQSKSEAFKREMAIKSYHHGEAFKKLLK